MRMEKKTVAEVKKSILAKKIFVYIFGLFLLALGVSVSIKSNLGVSPVNSLPYVLSRVLAVDMGIMTTSCFLFYILLQFILLGRKFQVRNLLQIVCSVLFGYFVSLTNRMVVFADPTSYALRIGLSCVSIILIAWGMTFYLAANLITMPSEGLILVISQKTGKQFHMMKIAFDCTIVVLAITLSFLGLHTLVGIREGTVFTAIAVGLVMAQIKRFCGGAITQFLS